jgi:formate C-acetyltransferase
LTGCGSPLIINEKKVMDGMVEFGYDKDDVWNFGTSACWEPLIIGKSFDQNNPLLNIPVIDSLNGLLESDDRYESFEEFLNTYKVVLKKQVLENIQDVEFDCSPLYSLFFDDCLAKQKDFSEGGAKYAYHGVQIVSFPNLINALLNLKTYVFEQKLFSMYECQQALKANFKGFNDMRQVLLSNPLKFGSTDKTVVDITNNLMQYISDVVATKTMNGKRTKVGFSSSHYLIVCKGVGASMDGRQASAPFAVHISPVSQKIDLQEVLDFAGSLDYSGNKMNGNVVDFIVPKVYADAPEKLMAILKNAMTTGVYELQLNVLNAATLKDAKAHPENYPSLVVRVWGFSAYFNDLPEEYKDNLIARAEAYAC